MVISVRKQSLRLLSFELVREKTNNLGSNQVRHKPAYTVTDAD